MPLAAGVYTRVRRWITDSNASIAIEPDLHDTEDDSIASALNLAWYRDGQAAATANIPMGGFKFTNLADGSGNADSVSLGQANSLYLLKAQLAAGLPVNASITSSVAGNALTIALKTGAGADASSASSILLPFRSATATDGAITVRSVTAASSLVISSGSKLGTYDSGPFRVWIVAFDDASTIRLGAIVCHVSTFDGLNERIDMIRRLRWGELVSSTAEGGAGAADTAGIFYTGTAVTTKPYCILGCLDWDAGLSTAGTWASDATRKQVYAPDMKLPGDIVQKVFKFETDVATGTTTLPFDNTAPQNTEGDQYLSLAITPTATMNILDIRHIGTYAHSAATGAVTAALFQDSTASALTAQAMSRDASAAAPAHGILHWLMRAATVSATTFKIRAGTGSAGTTTFAGSAGAGLYNNTQLCSLIIEEISV